MLRFMSMLQGGGREAPERLDQPLSNFDVIGIPRGSWSSSLLKDFFCCTYTSTATATSNANSPSPSPPATSLLACFCPCVIWAQVVVRAQIPLLIGLKNSLSSGGYSGYGLFIDYFFWSVAISVGLLVMLVLLVFPSWILFYLCIFALIAVAGTLIYLLGHTRTAFKEKYEIPPILPSCIGWDMVMDVFISITCLPCSLAQMARHVFQYHRMDTDIGFFYEDPSSLPPLRPLSSETGTFERPRRADNAGLAWTDNSRHPNVRDNRGAAHRQEELLARQRQELLNENRGVGSSAPPIAIAVPADQV